MGIMKELEKAIYIRFKRINTEQRWCFGVVIIIGIICHGYVFANKISYHDDIVLNGFGLTFAGGRWFLGIIETCLNYVGGVFSIPWFNGILSLLFIALSAAAIVELFQVKSKLGSALIGILMVVYPVTATAYAFMFNAWSDFLCLFLNILGARVVARSTKWYRRVVGGTVLFCMALGIYQAMFPFSVTLLMLILIFDTIERRGENSIQIIRQGSFYLGVLACGMFLYLIITTLLTRVGFFELSSYKGVNEIGRLELEKLPTKIGIAYVEFFKASFANIHKSICFAGVIKIIILCSVIMLAFMIFNNVYCKLSKCLLILLTALLPLGINLIYCFSTQDNFEVHTLMVYPTVLVLVVPVILLEKIESQIKNKSFGFLGGGLVALLFLLSAIYIYYDNSAYLKATFLQEQTIAWYDTLIGEIKGTEGYKDEYPVAYIGMYQADDMSFAHIPSMENSVKIMGYDFSMQDIVNDYKMYEFMSLRCGFEPVLYEDSEKLENKSEIREMPSYPDKGSIKVIDNVVVVKLH